MDLVKRMGKLVLKLVLASGLEWIILCNLI
jgi:hypothetical protein